MTYSRKPMQCVVDGAIERCVNRNDPEVTQLRAKVDGKTVARADVYEGEGGLLTIGIIDVDKKHRRSKLGTKLYEGALREACRRGLVLSSDSMRSPYAEAFWRKQVGKGRARCVPGKGESFDPSGEKVEGPNLPVPRQERGSPEAYWDCERYIVKTPCAVSSLEGLAGGGSRARKRQRKAVARDARVEAAERAENARLKQKQGKR